MQGQKSSVSTLPENLSFDHTASSDTDIDPQMPWDNLQTSGPNHLPQCLISLNDSNIPNLHHIRHEGMSGEWSVGQTSSSSGRNSDDRNEGKTELTWNIHAQAGLNLAEHDYQPSNVFSSDIVAMNPNVNQPPNRSSLLNNSGSRTLSHDLNISSHYENHDNDECQVVGHPNASMPIGSFNDQRVSAGCSSDPFRVPPGYGGYVMGQNEIAAVSLDGRRMSRKRKTFDVVGQTSGEGSSNSHQHTDRRQWNAAPAALISSSHSGISMQEVTNHATNNVPEQSNPRFRLGIGESAPTSPFSLSASGNPENSHRSFRLHINGSQQNPVPGIPFSTETEVGNVDVSASRRSSRLFMRNRLLNLNPSPEAETVSNRGQSVLLHAPSLRLNPQTRWNGASISRTSRPTASSISIGRDTATYEESVQRHVPRDISEHPMFVPSERRASSPYPTNWNFNVGNSSFAGNVSSSSLLGPSSGVNSTAPSWTHRSYPQYSRRLSEIVRRSLISSAGTESEGQSSNLSGQSSVSATTQEVALAGSGNHVHVSNSRSALLERHAEGAFGLPYPLRTLATASEGRSSIMSEIRHVLDLMRRGESLRLEDVMILDHPVFLGMVDIHDRHRDMRLDVDNMSYEELLALEERIGNVCIGLNEETITKCLKTRKILNIEVENSVETEPCSICREEYTVGEELGKLECGHDFHKDCIKQWLMHKNLCPICKTTGLPT